MSAQLSSLELADQARAEIADLLDLQLSPLGLAAMDALAPRAGQTILDIGCGAGQTLLQLAEKLGSAGRVIGVDNAPRVLDVARLRAQDSPRIQLIQGDAQELALPAEAVDGIYSRFGVMGMADPVVAFKNFRRMTKAGGRFAFVCWRSLQENELDRLPLEAADAATAIDPTPFKFERRDHLRDVLRTAGFSNIEIAAFDANVSCGDVDATMKVLTKVGALGKILRENPDLHSSVEPRLRDALSNIAKNGEVALTAATWIVSATA